LYAATSLASIFYRTTDKSGAWSGGQEQRFIFLAAGASLAAGVSFAVGLSLCPQGVAGITGMSPASII
jgi:hypothetical protein